MITTASRRVLRPSTVVAGQCRALSGGAESVLPTVFNELHRSLGGKMVPFAGYELPVLYESEDGGVLKEHRHTRSKGCASLFDVSHMGQIKWHGSDRVAFVEKMVVGDIEALNAGEARLSLICNESGGILDDTVVTNSGDYTYMVVNGATKHDDMAHFRRYLEENSAMDVEMEYLGDDATLLALQGDGAMAALQRHLPSSMDLTKMPFMTGTEAVVGGIEGCRVTRCGYTGEDGFELAIPVTHAVGFAEALLAEPEVNPAGLGARDSLRLEAGLCLYGHDLNDTINPVEGSLAWTIGRPKSRRRTEGGFLGAGHILGEGGKLKATERKRVGIVGMKAPAREGMEIYDAEGESCVGVITSGTLSPTLKRPIAMGYVPKAHAKEGSQLQVKVRNKLHKAEVTKMPFVQTNYYAVP